MAICKFPIFIFRTRLPAGVRVWRVAFERVAVSWRASVRHPNISDVEHTSVRHISRTTGQQQTTWCFVALLPGVLLVIISWGIILTLGHVWQEVGILGGRDSAGLLSIHFHREENFKLFLPSKGRKTSLKPVKCFFSFFFFSFRGLSYLKGGVGTPIFIRGFLLTFSILPNMDYEETLYFSHFKRIRLVIKHDLYSINPKNLLWFFLAPFLTVSNTHEYGQFRSRLRIWLL